MLVLLPTLTFALLWDLFASRHPEADPREALLSAALVWGVLVVVFTEALSFFSWLTQPGLALCWGGSALAVAALAVRQRSPRRSWFPVRIERSPLMLLMSGAIALIVVVTGLIAILAWPNNSDSMVYHLSRVVHWIQNRDVAFYPTNISRQLFSAPWSEYAILHLILLSGDSRFGNLVQWSSMLGSLAGVSLIARQLGASPRGQVLAALVCATLPMGILQATSTQNDYVVAFWLVSATYWLLLWRNQPASLAFALAAAGALGLAGLTKGTAYIFALPLPLLLILARRDLRLPDYLKTAPPALFLALLLNLPHFVRNYDLYGSPIGPARPWEDSVRFSNLTTEAYSLPIFISNVVRHTALHLVTPFPALNQAVEGAIRDWHARLGLDVDDQRSTWSVSFRLPPALVREHVVSNPLHLLLIPLALGTLVAARALRRDMLLWSYALVLVLGFGLFCLLIKWQTYLSRLYLPLFVLWAPLIGVALQRYARLTLAVALVIIAAASPYLLINEARPLLGENSVLSASAIGQSFRQGQGKLPGYIGATNFVRSLGCSEVGLLLGWADWEYPFWVLLPETGLGRVRLEHVGVENGSRRFPISPPRFSPCAILVTSIRVSDPLLLGERTYVPAWSGGGVTVLVEDGR
jgi:4-amino-4-deoxy-L-arabinose transferase-like glycosyltransferase